MGVSIKSWDWLAGVRSDTPTNLSNLVTRPNRSLTLGGLRISLSVFDRAVMALAEQAQRTAASFVVVHPDPYAPTAVYTELAAHIFRMGTTEGNRTDLRVALVSRNNRLRTVHRRIRLSQLGPMEAIVPTETVTRAGSLYRYGDSTIPGSTVFIEDMRDLGQLGDVGLIIVDAPCAHLATALEFGCPVIYVVRDPSDRSIASLASKLPTFAWSSDDVANTMTPMLLEGPELAHSRLRLEQKAAGIELEIIPIRSYSIADWSAQIWADFPQIISATPHSAAARDLVQLAFRRYYELLHLVVPTRMFQRRFGSFESRARAIASASRLVAGEAGEFYLPCLASELGDFASAIGSESPKVGALERCVRALAAQSATDRTYVAAPTVDAAALVEEWLEERLGDDRPTVVPLSALPRLAPVEHLILTGLPPTWARSVLSSGIAHHIYVLAYEREQEANHAAMPSEAALVNRLISAGRAYENWMAREPAKIRCWAKIVGEQALIDDPQPNPPQVESPDLASESERVVTSLWASITDPTDILHYRAGGSHEEGSPGSVLSNAIRVELFDGRWMLLAPNSWVTKLTGVSADAGIEADRLRVGDTLVIIDEDPRKALLDKVIEVGASVPEYEVVADFVQAWRNALRSGYQQFGTYVQFRDELERRGTTVTRQAIRNWVTGKSIGPQDRADVRRVGEVVGDGILVRKHTLICNAITKLRGIHVKLGVRLAAFARQDGVAGALGVRESDELVDELSGLTVGDFRSCVEFVKISRIEPFGEVPIEMIGRLRKGDE